MVINIIFPSLFAVVKQPLELESDDALITGPRNYLTFGFIINDGRALLQQVLFDDRLRLFNSLAFCNTNKHHTLIESL